MIQNLTSAACQQVAGSKEQSSGFALWAKRILKGILIGEAIYFADVAARHYVAPLNSQTMNRIADVAKLGVVPAIVAPIADALLDLNNQECCPVMVVHSCYPF